MKKILMFFVATALVFGFAGVTGATQFTLSDIKNSIPDKLSLSNLISFLDKPTLPQFPEPTWAGPGGGQGGGHHGGGRGSAPVPEPATMLLFGCGLIGLAAVGRKKFQQGNTK